MKWFSIEDVYFSLNVNMFEVEIRINVIDVDSTSQQPRIPNGSAIDQPIKKH